MMELGPTTRISSGAVGGDGGAVTVDRHSFGTVFSICISYEWCCNKKTLTK
jgi:hypothetical protein